MPKLTKILIIQFFLASTSLMAQPFDQAPDLTKPVRQIVEWQRTNLKSTMHKAAISRFDQQGNLLKYSDFRAEDAVFSYAYDSKNRIIRKSERIEGVEHTTSYEYRPGVAISELKFHEKTYRTCIYSKGQKVMEKKEFVKGGELEKKHLLLRWTHFQYNAQNQLLVEKTDHYAVQGRRKGKKIFTEIVRHHYDGKFLTYSQYFNADASMRMVKYFRYNKQGLLKQEIEHYPVEDRLDTTEYLYQNGKLWQKIEESENQRRVLVHVEGRPIRLRTYLDGALTGVVDYAYEYF